MPARKKTDGNERIVRSQSGQPSSSLTPATKIFQEFSQQIELVVPAKMPMKANHQATDVPQQPKQATSQSSPDWEQGDIMQTLINSLLAGTFDENINVHAENLAEKLIERQRELDRRESQLNLRSAELENKVRQARLDNVPMQAASEIEKTIEAELAVYEQSEAGHTGAQSMPPTAQQVAEQAVIKSANDPTNSIDENPAEQLAEDNFVTHRLDKFSESQRAPYSLLNKRWKRYIEDTKTDHTIKVQSQKSVKPAAATQEPAEAAHRTAISDLTKRAAIVRQRGEEVEAMYEQLREIYAEMLRQQTGLRQVINTMQVDGKKAGLSRLEAAKSTLARLTVGLSRVGSQHFPIPEGSSDAA